MNFKYLIKALLFIVLFQIQNNVFANENQTEWAINIFPDNSGKNPLKITFIGKQYNNGKGLSLSSIRKMTEAERFINYVVKTYNNGSLTDISNLWHPSDQDQFEFLGIDDFNTTHNENYKTGTSIDVKLLSHINYGQLNIFYIATQSISNTIKIITFTIIFENKRFYLTRRLKNKGEKIFFKNYKDYLYTLNIEINN